MRKYLGIAVLGLLAGSLAPLPGCAQTPDDATQAARAALHQGDYESARTRFRAVLNAADVPAPEAVLGYTDALLATGAYREGLAQADAALATFAPAAPGAPLWHHARGRLLAALGRYADAEAAYRLASSRPLFWQNTVALGSVLEATGRAGEGASLYATLFRRYQQGELRTADALRAAAHAAARLEQFRDANSAYRTAYELERSDPDVLYGWAELFRAKYNDADARRTYEEALGLNPRHADALVGLARSGAGFGQQEELAQRALAANVNHVGALSLLSSLRILDGLYDEAEALAEQALAVNPSSVEVLAHLAAVHYLRGDTAAFVAVEQRALAVNPRASDFFLTLAEDAERRFRYPAALAFAQRATEVDPRDVRAYAAVGTSLLRLGRAAPARRYLQAAFDRDPFNLFVANTLTLLDAYEDFDVLESPHFSLLLHRDEHDALGPLMLAEAEAAYAALSERYPYTPSGKIRLEAYHDADDFAVRIAGVPHLGLLGVSFGDVVAINTPKAQERGAYNWARTLWHELAHTMAIGASDHQVPRWFTEGLSVYEEQRAEPAWGREMDLDLFQALDQGRLLPLAEIDRGFTRPSFPGQVLLSYYHASRVIAYVVDQHGFEAIAATLQSLARGNNIAAALEQATGQSLAVLDLAFRADLQRQRADLAPLLADLPDTPKDDAGTPLADPTAAPTGNTFFRLLYEAGTLLRAERFTEAEPRYREALDLYQAYAGPGNPYLGLAAVYRARGDRAALKDVLAQYLEVTDYGAEAARELATLHAEDGAPEAARRYLERSLQVEPYDLDARARLAALYDAEGRTDAAVAEHRAVLALGPVDRADAYYRLARTLHAAGRQAPAKRAVLQSLELAPGFREAQKLLLEVVGG